MKEANILDGDIVGIHAQEDADNGQIVAAVMPHPKTGEDEITLKRYLRRGKKGSRVAKLVDAPNLPDDEAAFMVTEAGLTDV